MDESFNKFCKEINFEITSNLEGSLISDVSLIEREIDKQPITYFNLSFFSIPSHEQLKEFFEKSKLFFRPSIIEWKIYFINKNFSTERIYDLLSFYLFEFHKIELSKYLKIDNFLFDVSNNVLSLEFESIISYNNFSEQINIEEFLNFFSLQKELQIYLVNKSEQLFENIKEEQNKTDLLDSLKIKEQLERLEKEKKNNSTFYNRTKEKFFKLSIENFYLSHERFILIEGKIFNIEITKTKTNLIIVNLSITDEEEALIAKYFLREGETNKYENLNIGDYVSISGEKKQEYNMSSFFLQVSNITKINLENHIDRATKKRIEFSLRTSMSAMDGFVEPIKILKHAKALGHEAVAFCDFQNIQSFPDIYNNAKKIGIKPIYGCTFSIIPKEHNMIINYQKNKNINLEKYVIFDIETTSLNPRYGEIIEFGAIVIENEIIIETHQFFIKPSTPISSFTYELTGITQEMVDTKSKFSNQEEAINEIIRIFSDATLVAHNAQFDIGFINEKLDQLNREKIKNQIIDTLVVARYLFPISQSYRLEIVAKKLDIIYDPNIAHRADYDARILENVWLKMINLLLSKSIKTFEDLKNINESYLNDKKFDYDLAVYAKNQEGLKELFKLVSLSLTTNFYGGPRLFEEDVKKYKNILVGPASINTKLIDLMQTGTKENLINEINKWDFVGIPSPHLFSHLLARNNYSEKELKQMLKEVILLAKKFNKIIIAVGDVRYLDDCDQKAHEIYINTKGLEGKRHYLYKFNEIKPNYPIQKYLSTEEMKKNFEFLNSETLIEEIVVTNTNRLNSLIADNIEVIKKNLFSPNFDNSQNKIVDLVYQNAKNIYGEKLPEKIVQRIERELKPIIKYGFSVVYWISQKLVAKSLSDGYLVGSRGSVGSSIVATLLNITEVNPLEPHYICKKCKHVEFISNSRTSSGFDLPDKKCDSCNVELEKNGQTIPFETFLGFDGDKIPDIDLNFSGEYQQTIHNEVRKIFGFNHSFRAGTISTVATKTAYGFVKKYFEEKEINKSNTFINYLVQKITGSKRTTGQHPGGIIIVPKEYDVEDFTPINYPANDIKSNWQTTHFDFHAIHDNLLKLDLLGHDDPTVIRHLQKLTNVKISDISFSDKNVLKLFSSTEPLGIKPQDINNEETGVLGVPEFGTKFVRRMLRVAKPSSFNDLINLSGLSHGTDVWNGNAEDLVKQGKTLNDVICCRDDIMVYLMKKGLDSLIAFQIMENVRKGKGLTVEEEKILKEHGIEKWYIDSLNKIKYMFPKAHATAYVMMAWRIAWFKIYYPLEYYATFFTVRSDVFDFENTLKTKEQVQKRLLELEKKQYVNDNKNKITAKEEELITIFEIINEMMARKIKVQNVDLYKSDATEWKIDYQNQALIPPFIVLDGLGEAAAKSIIEARKEKEFSSREDILKRTSVNKTVLEKMNNLGILDGLEESEQLRLF